MKRVALIIAIALGVVGPWPGSARAQTSAAPAAPQPDVSRPGAPLKIGVLTDMNGILSSALGKGSVDGARMAIEDFGGTMFGKPIELVVGDHQNRPDVGSAMVRQWLDQDGVDVIADVGNSAVALATRDLVEARNKVALFVGASSSDLTGKACSANTVQWSHDTYLFGSALPRQLLQDGKKTWFLIVQDWAFGHDLQRVVTQVVNDNGGRVVGSLRHAPGTTDYSSILLQAQASGADVIALLSAVQDLSNTVKQVHEFGIGADHKQQVAALTFLLSDAHGLGIDAAQGITFSTVWYWDLNPAAHAWSERFFARNGFMPGEAHAGTYSAVTHYLKAVQASGTTQGDVVVRKMRDLPVTDFYTDHAVLRRDGRLMRNAYIARIKTPAESKGPWDLYDIVATIPAEQAFRPISEGACPLLN